MPIQHIRLSQHAKDQLVWLKRWTHIKNWNVLCRWAFCTSIAEPSVPPHADIPADSSVEMTWKVFGGPLHELYLGLLKERCDRDGLGMTDEALGTQFRLHLHRGISYLAADKSIRSIGALLRRASPSSE